jgi:hypothetical protein
MRAEPVGRARYWRAATLAGGWGSSRPARAANVWGIAGRIFSRGFKALRTQERVVQESLSLSETSSCFLE